MATITLGLAVLGTSAASADEVYTVESGDTLYNIADGVDDTSWQDLAEINADEISDPDVIHVGQILALTGDASAVEPESTPAEASEPEAAPQAPEPESAATPASSGTVATSTWDAIAQCESTGDWSINTGNGYYGGLQFTISSWNAVGGSGLPSDASKAEQIARAEELLELQGWGAWPECSSQLGLS